MTFHRIALAILAAGSVCAAQAADGTVTITGSLGAATCGVSAGTQTVTVTLPPGTATGALANAGDTAGLTTFDLALSNCYGKSSATITFDAASANLDSNGRLINNGTATNVVVEIAKKDGSQGYNLKTFPGTTIAIDSQLGTGSTSLAARYYSLGGATAGTVTTSVGFSVTYQ